MTSGTTGTGRPSERHVLVALLNGIRVGSIYQTSSGPLRFVYLEEWQNTANAYPLSLSMPLTAQEHRHEAITSFLWGLLPDNERTLGQYGRLFGVSARNPVALLTHIGADCAGAVQFAPPELAERLEDISPDEGSVEWLSDEQIATDLRSVREYGIPGISRQAVGQFSLAGAQPKIALLEENGKWGRPNGRIPTNRILKPPSGEFHGFAENEHFCLELASALALGAVTSRVARFDTEVAIVVERFDRERQNGEWLRIHQEDVCQALGVMPSRKYENEGGPGISDTIAVLQEASTRPDDDVTRFVRATALNWVLAATDAHAKNYALLHGSQGVRLAPFYDLLSYLPYSDNNLHHVNLAMKIGGEYQVRRITRRHWSTLAAGSRITERAVIDNVFAILELLPAAVDRTMEKSTAKGLDASIVENLGERIGQRIRHCIGIMNHLDSA